MGSWREGIWTNGRKKLKGFWQYYWAGDYFVIQLNGKDTYTGISRQPFRCYNDSPEWGKWKLKREKINEEQQLDVK